MTTVIVTGAAGDTGRPCVELLLEKGLNVRALVRTDDARAQRLRDLGAQVVLGDMMKLLQHQDRAGWRPKGLFLLSAGRRVGRGGLVIFAQAAKEQQLELIVNNSHKQSRPAGAQQGHAKPLAFRAGFRLVRSDIDTLLITSFQEWLLYIAPLIRHGRYVMPYDASSRFAPIALYCPVRGRYHCRPGQIWCRSSPSMDRSNTAMRNWLPKWAGCSAGQRPTNASRSRRSSISSACRTTPPSSATPKQSRSTSRKACWLEQTASARS